jgi:predicted SAM-dependent methyltransferase
MKYLNFGCGNRFSTEWTNIDFGARSPGVIQCNLLQGFPFRDNSFDAVYSSHVLEHFTLDQGECLLKEAFRVLKPRGLIRTVVPDLESAIREYVRVVQHQDGSLFAEKQHEWIMLELLDQLVRAENQGEITKFKRQVLDSGDQALISYIDSRTGDMAAVDVSPARASSRWTKFLGASPGKLRQKMVMTWVRLVKSLIPRHIAASILDNTTLGEKHRWMYDITGLKRSLARSGFRDMKLLDASTSQIPNFGSYGLDLNPDGKPHKLLSLYVEASKPDQP